jgi:CheY-like chemotaxis protein
MSKKILIVDDNEGDRKLIAEALSDAQVEVDLVDAQTGDEAIRLAQDEKPDLILMDVMMPGMNGGDAVKLLKSDKRTDGIPIVFLTGMYGKEDEKAHGKININEEFYDSIAKPFDETKLITTINKYV